MQGGAGKIILSIYFQWLPSHKQRYSPLWGDNKSGIVLKKKRRQQYEKDEKIRRMKEYIYKIVQDMEEKPEEMTGESILEK